MISELEYSGPPPSAEPKCDLHGCHFDKHGECPVCRDEARARDAEDRELLDAE